uniref:Serine/threonine-protein phosphatase Pgam5, mitochondrial n=1 Tax=Panagrellus redivivus TaxID=6233 RepID=A0A7E4VUK6_PANRE
MPLSIDIAFKWGKKKDPVPPEPPTASTTTTTTTATTTCSGSSCTTNTTDDAAMMTVKDGTTVSQATQSQQFVSAEENVKSSKSSRAKKKKALDTKSKAKSKSLAVQKTQKSMTVSQTGTEHTEATTQTQTLTEAGTQASRTQNSQSTMASVTGELGDTEADITFCSGKSTQSLCSDTQHISETAATTSTAMETAEGVTKSQTGTTFDTKSIRSEGNASITGGLISTVDDAEEVSQKSVKKSIVAKTAVAATTNEDEFISLGGGASSDMHTIESTNTPEDVILEKAKMKKPIVKPKVAIKPKPKPKEVLKTAKTQTCPTEEFKSLAQSQTQSMTQEYVTAAEDFDDDYVKVKTRETTEEYFTVDEYYTVPKEEKPKEITLKDKSLRKHRIIMPSPGETIVEPGLDEVTAIDDVLTPKASHICPTQTTTSINTGEENSIEESTQSTLSEVASPAATPPEGANKPAIDHSLLPRRLILIRHAERMDRVFPSWLRQANAHGTYRPYNTNQPRQLPKRRRGLPAFEFDPPVTEVGRLVAQLAGKSVRRSGFQVKAIYCSPALRCIETAQVVVRELGQPDLRIRVEPGLFDWFSYYESAPVFLTPTELIEAGYLVCKNYRPVMTREVVVKNFHYETKHDYYRRAQDIVQKILSSTVGTVIIIAHATTLDGSARALLDLPKSIPSDQQLDRLADRYPYCSTILLEQQKENGLWRLGRQLLPLTFLNQSTKFDRNFLLRK